MIRRPFCHLKERKEVNHFSLSASFVGIDTTMAPRKKSRKAPEEPTDPEIDVQYLKSESESDSDDSSSSEVV